MVSKSAQNLLVAHTMSSTGKTLDEYETKLLAEAPMQWEATVNRVYKVKEQVNNLQNDEVDKIKAHVEQFEDQLQQFRKDYREQAPFVYECDVNEAYERIHKQHGAIAQLDAQAQKLNDLERVFELSVSRHRQIGLCRNENGVLKLIWDMVSVVRTQLQEWQRTLWDKIDTDILVEKSKALQKQITKLPKECRGWSVYQGLQSEVKNLLTVLPLVTLLHSPSMSERHWKDLMTSTKKHFVMGPDFCLADLLKLELHRFVSDVEDIVELATKESKIGAQLLKISGNWETLELVFGTHKDTDIGLIKDTEEVMQALEENMASLQSMQGMGKYVDHFVDQVGKWQQSLGQVRESAGRELVDKADNSYRPKACCWTGWTCSVNGAPSRASSLARRTSGCSSQKTASASTRFTESGSSSWRRPRQPRMSSMPAPTKAGPSCWRA